ncbi:hypothetical protein D3C75_986630 [compost metagenome]
MHRGVDTVRCSVFSIGIVAGAIVESVATTFTQPCINPTGNIGGFAIELAGASRRWHITIVNGSAQHTQEFGWVHFDHH